MLSRAVKETFYRSMALPMRINGWIYRKFRAPTAGVIKAHLGPGKKKYLPGWYNVDANCLTARIDIWTDLRFPLPFKDNTVDAIYSHHVIEHLPDNRLLAHFREMFRILKPGGVIRVGGPDSGNAAKKFAEGDISWFGNFPDPHDSIGGKFTNFVMCRDQHLTILSLSYLTEICTQVGFTNIDRVLPVRQTHHPQLFNDVLKMEFEEDFDVPHTLLIEAEKTKG